MSKKRFEIEFDKHGNICVDDPELATRLKWLLVHNGRLVVRLGRRSEGLAENIPRLLTCPIGLFRCPPPPNLDCPNYYCPEGGLRVVRDAFHDERWGDVMQSGPGGGLGSEVRPGPDG